MKKMVFAAFAFAAASVFAAQNDILLTFSTKGPDKYANGDTVADGECYCVVWTKTGAEFEGFEADGSAKGANSKVVLTAPIAKDGCCPKTQFQISYKTANALGSGRYGVYLLDTRSANGGAPQGTVRIDGVWTAKAINNWGVIADATTELATVSTLKTTTVASTTSDNVASIESSVPAETPDPVVKSIRVENGKVYVTVTNTASYLQYTLEQGDEPGKMAKDDGLAAQGNGDEITITRPMPENANGGFFRVIRK